MIYLAFTNRQDAKLIDKGTFVVDEIEHSGPPNTLTIRARSADFRDSLLEYHSKSWDTIQLGVLVNEIAAAHQLTAKVSASLAQVTIEHLDQTNESNAHLLTRLAKHYDAIATIKNGILLFVAAGAGKTASGLDFKPAEIRRDESITHRYMHSDTVGRYTGVKAYWHNKRKAKKQEVIVGSKGYLRTLKKQFANRELALAAAAAEWKQLNRKVKTLNLELATALPMLVAEQPCRVSGFKSEIDQVVWIVGEAKHRLVDDGLRSTLSLIQQ